MSVDAFSAVIKSKVYTDWLEKLDANIVNSTVDALRASQQSASKTSFILSEKNVQDIFKTITGKSLPSFEAKLFIDKIAAGDKTPNSIIKINGKDRAVKFDSIGFDTISTKVRDLIDEYDDVQEAYFEARDKFELENKASLAADKSISAAERKKRFNAIEKAAKEIGFGKYFNKGHVVSIATNLSKEFRDKVASATELAEGQRKLLVEVLDKYIAKLQADDLASANLPDAVNQELYASYIKSSDKYLVEIQGQALNQESGRKSILAVTELRSIFSVNNKDLEAVIAKSPALGESLLNTKGSPSFIDLLAQKLANIVEGTPVSKKVYRVPKTKIAARTIKVDKPANNKTLISKLKGIKAKLKTTSSASPVVQAINSISTTSLISLPSLLVLLQANIVQQVKQNMGDGSSSNVLNLQSGRFAESVRVERLSESRAGMVTAFYSYMRNPYATFSQGGRQEFPKTRDPKLLISRSVRDIAAEQVGNRLRAVLV
jgi:hypothetical protein